MDINRPRHQRHRGNEYIIESGSYRAVIFQQGSALKSLTWEGIDIVTPSPAEDIPHSCAGQLLIPYPNRIEDGQYTFEGIRYELPIDEHERNNAIHGYGYRAMWNLDSVTETSITQSWRTPYLSGYPFDLRVRAAYTADAEGLHVTVTAHNADTKNAPWACAMHPWLANGSDAHGDAIDAANAQCRLAIPADTHVTIDGRLLPTGTENVDGTQYDLRDGPTLEGRPFDDAWTDVRYNTDGLATAVFTRPDGITVELSGDRTVTSFQVCTGTGFPEGTRPQGVAVEPQTAYANAFRSGIGLISIAPGEEVSTTIHYSAHRAE